MSLCFRAPCYAFAFAYPLRYLYDKHSYVSSSWQPLLLPRDCYRERTRSLAEPIKLPTRRSAPVEAGPEPDLPSLTLDIRWGAGKRRNGENGTASLLASTEPIILEEVTMSTACWTLGHNDTKRPAFVYGPELVAHPKSAQTGLDADQTQAKLHVQALQVRLV